MSFIGRFLRGLISGFPFFIPHALDFIESLREMTPDRYKASLVSQLQLVYTIISKIGYFLNYGHN